MNLTIWYDTGHYNNQWSWCLASDFTLTGIRDDYGTVRFEPKPADSGCFSFQTNYRTRMGYRSVSLFAHSEKADQLAPGNYLARIFAGTERSEGSVARLVLEAPNEGIVLLPNGSQWSRWVDQQPASITQSYVFAHPEAIEAYAVEETSHYVLMTPATFDEAAQARVEDVVKAAEDVFPRLEALSGRSAPLGGKYLVLFAPDPLFDWEAGWYREGIIALRASAFTAPQKDWRLGESRALVHETYHAFMGEILHWAGSHGDWWNEGNARYAERLVEEAHPDWLLRCDPGYYCLNLSARIDYDTLASHYAAASASYSRDWSPQDAQSKAARQFGYDYGGYLVAAYIQQHGLAAYQTALARLSSHAVTDVDPACASCVLTLLEEDLLSAAGREHAEDLYLPYQEEYRTDREAFETAVRPLVVMERSIKPTSRGSAPSAGSSSLGENPPDIPAVGELGPAQSWGALVGAPGGGFLGLASPWVTLAGLALPAYVYFRHIRQQERALPTRSGLRKLPLHGNAYAYGAQGTLFTRVGADVLVSDEVLQVRTKPHAALLPRGSLSFLLNLLLFGWPFLLVAPIQDHVGVLASSVWLGLSLAWALVIGVELTRHPRVVWDVTDMDVTMHEGGRFDRPREALRLPVGEVEAVLLLASAGAPAAQEVVLRTRRGDYRIIAYAGKEYAQEAAARIARLCRCPLQHPSAPPTWNEEGVRFAAEPREGM